MGGPFVHGTINEKNRRPIFILMKIIKKRGRSPLHHHSNQQKGEGGPSSLIITIINE